MVRAHAVGADFSASHLFSSFSNLPFNTGRESGAEKVSAFSPSLSALPRYSTPRSILERFSSVSKLTESQLQMDAIDLAFSESAKNGSALMLLMGAGALLRNVKLSASLAEGMFAGFANMSARTRLAAGALATLALAGCENQDYGYIRSGNKPDAGTPDGGTVDGGSDASEAVDAGSSTQPSFLIKRVNVGLNGEQANDESWSPGLSDNGHVVYVTSATSLSPNHRVGDFDVMVGSTVITKDIPSYGENAYNRTPIASISGNGDHIVFSQRYYDAFYDWYGSYVVKIKSGDNSYEFNTNPVFHSGDQADDCMPAVDYKGERIVYVAYHNPYFGQQSSGQIRIADWVDRGVVSTKGYDNHQIGNGFSSHPKISGDGKWVTFVSDANDLISGMILSDHGKQIYARQILNLNTPSQWIDLGATLLISEGIDGKPGNGDSNNPSISTDNGFGGGHVIAFDSDASNLVPNDTNQHKDIFVAGTGVEIISLGKGGEPSNGESYSPSISADGRFVAFVSEASNLVDGDTNGVADIFVHDRKANQTKRVNLGQGLLQANGSSLEPFIAPDGHALVFTSYANNLVTNDTNNVSDIFYVSLNYFFK